MSKSVPYRSFSDHKRIIRMLHNRLRLSAVAESYRRTCSIAAAAAANPACRRQRRTRRHRLRPVIWHGARRREVLVAAAPQAPQFPARITSTRPLGEIGEVLIKPDAQAHRQAGRQRDCRPETEHHSAPSNIINVLPSVRSTVAGTSRLYSNTCTISQLND